MTSSRRQSRVCLRIRASLPPWREALFGALAWGSAMMASAAISLFLDFRLEFANALCILGLYFAGGALAWPFCLYSARLTGLGRSAETRFAACFLALAVGTVAMTAFLFSQHYRLFYAQWHQPFGTRIWMFQFVFTSAPAVYQFLLSGLRLYLPTGLVVIVATSLWLARRIR